MTNGFELEDLNPVKICVAPLRKIMTQPDRAIAHGTPFPGLIWSVTWRLERQGFFPRFQIWSSTTFMDYVQSSRLERFEVLEQTSVPKTIKFLSQTVFLLLLVNTAILLLQIAWKSSGIYSYAIRTLTAMRSSIHFLCTCNLFYASLEMPSQTPMQLCVTMGDKRHSMVVYMWQKG